MNDRDPTMRRNEYDPRPNLGKADYPGFEWDDGAGRIADAIIADKTLLLRKHADEIAALRASSPAQEPVTTEPVAWTNEAQLGFLKEPGYRVVPMAMWAFQHSAHPIALYAIPAPPQPGRDAVIEDVYACCELMLIGFSDELTEQQRKFICDQISRKVALDLTGEPK